MDCLDLRFLALDLGRKNDELLFFPCQVQPHILELSADESRSLDLQNMVALGFGERLSKPFDGGLGWSCFGFAHCHQVR